MERLAKRQAGLQRTGTGLVINGGKAAFFTVSGGEAESTGPAATGFVWLVVKVKKFEPVHHHIQF